MACSDGLTGSCLTACKPSICSKRTVLRRRFRGRHQTKLTASCSSPCSADLLATLPSLRTCPFRHITTPITLPRAPSKEYSGSPKYADGCAEDEPVPHMLAM